jgi:hypothetical protein
MILAAMIFAIPCAPSIAQTTAQKPDQQAPINVVGEHPNDKKVPDPNEVICEKQHEIGSRLVTKRVCMTRAQWAEQRRLNREDLDRAQMQRPMGN